MVQHDNPESKAPRLSKDIISTLPLNIIETILCLVPIKDAAKTSILSRNWRYTWLTIPKLEFFEEDFEVDETLRVTTDAQNSKRCKLSDAIQQVLLVHRGPIHEFTLSTDTDYTRVQIDKLILHLSTKCTLKKLTLKLLACKQYEVPLSIFSSHQLTDLSLHGCAFEHPVTSIKEFGSLTTLYLEEVCTSLEELLHLISNFPLLKNLTLIMSDYIDQMFNANICEVFECLPPAIEHLTISQLVIQCFALHGVPREPPTSLVHLKSFGLENMSCCDGHGLPFLLLVIRCSPNLEKIKLHVDADSDPTDDIFEIDFADYSDIRLEHLNELEIKNFTNLRQEIEFVKFILAKSPVLKKVNIHHSVDKDEESKILKSLLRGPHVSPLVDIIVEPSSAYNF